MGRIFTWQGVMQCAEVLLIILAFLCLLGLQQEALGDSLGNTEVVLTLACNPAGAVTWLGNLWMLLRGDLFIGQRGACTTFNVLYALRFLKIHIRMRDDV